MNEDLEEDFKYQQSRLMDLLHQRKALRDGSQEAIQADLEIGITQDLIRSYETLQEYPL
jgi:hypothetical protein